MNLNCPNCKNAFEVVRSGSQTEVTCPSCKSKISLIDLLSINDELSHTLSLVKDNPDENLGEEIGQFRLEKVLGHGGFGTVFEAYDVRLERRVALKLPKMATMSRWQAEVFIREAQAAAQLQHPNIVSVHEIGREDGRVFIVSELIDGMTLNEWRTAEKPDANKAAILLAKIARALHVAHAAGVVHRDIKPRNILIDYQGEPHITDFGLAKRDNPHNDSITRPGQVIGTPAYMSPEQAMGKADEADGRTDIYSLGVILYEMLVGKRPYRGESDVITEEVIRGGAASPKELDKSIHPDIDAICMKAMERVPGKRYRSAGELADDLESFASDLPTKVLPPTKVQSAVRGVKRNRRNIVLLVCGLFVGAAVLGGWWWFSSLPPDNRIEVEFSVSEPNCVVRIVKVDEELGRIDYSNIILPKAQDARGGGLRFSASLTHGWHIIEAESPDGNIAEVWRLVPKTTNDGRLDSYKATGWTPIGKRHIELSPISIIGFNESELLGGIHEMIVESEGSFDVGAENLFSAGVEMRPREELHIPSFAIGKFEVSAHQFRSVMSAFPIEMQGRLGREAVIETDLVATGVSFIEAIEYCERVGGRLPVFEEYLFAATNRGNTKYPWGEHWVFQDWKIGVVGQPARDVNQSGVYNLFSNAVEWTGDVAIPKSKKPDGESTDFPEELMSFLRGQKSARLVVGCAGAASFGEIDEMPNTGEHPRYVFQQPTDENNPSPKGLGFRVYRSVKPRIRKTRDLIRYYIDNGKGDHRAAKY